MIANLAPDTATSSIKTVAGGNLTVRCDSSSGVVRYLVLRTDSSDRVPNGLWLLA